MMHVSAQEISSEYAMNKAGYFRTKIDDYLAVHPEDKDTSIPYTTMTRQRDGFMRDANALLKANMEWNMFAPAAELFARSVMRVDAMQFVLPDVATDDTNFTDALAPHADALRGQVASTGLNKEHGKVTTAMADYRNARSAVSAAALGFAEVINQELMAPMLEMKREKGEKKEEIEHKMHRISGTRPCRAMRLGAVSSGACIGWRSTRSAFWRSGSGGEIHPCSSIIITPRMGWRWSFSTHCPSTHTLRQGK